VKWNKGGQRDNIGNKRSPLSEKGKRSGAPPCHAVHYKTSTKIEISRQIFPSEFKVYYGKGLLYAKK